MWGPRVSGGLPRPFCGGVHFRLRRGAVVCPAAPCRDKSYVVKFLRGHLPADLREVPGAIGCLYGALPDVDEYGSFILPQPLLEHYHAVGYLKLPGPVLDAAQSDRLADEANELANNKEHHPKTEYLYGTSLADLTGGPLFFCQGQWRAAWGMHDLVYLPTLTVPACQVLGSLVRLWYDEVYIKEARNGPCIPWQQGYARWQPLVHPQRHVTCFIALDTLDSNRSAPCLIPGSHRWRGGELLPQVPYDPSAPEAAQLNTIWDIVDDEEREQLMEMPPATVPMRRGEALLLHPNLLYATHGNRTLERARYALVHYMGKGVQAAVSGPLLPGATAFAPGADVQGPFFPIVFDPALSEELALPAETGDSSDAEYSVNLDNAHDQQPQN